MERLMEYVKLYIRKVFLNQSAVPGTTAVTGSAETTKREKRQGTHEKIIALAQRNLLGYNGYTRKQGLSLPGTRLKISFQT